jgi:hypothetical protein
MYVLAAHPFMGEEDKGIFENTDINIDSIYKRSVP